MRVWAYLSGKKNQKQKITYLSDKIQQIYINIAQVPQISQKTAMYLHRLFSFYKIHPNTSTVAPFIEV